MSRFLKARSIPITTLSAKVERGLGGKRANEPLLANPVIIARAVLLDVQVEMLGVIGIAGPQNGREPSAAGAPDGLHEGQVLRVGVVPDREPAPVDEDETGHVNRNASSVRADFRAGDMVLRAAIVARSGVERGHRRLQLGARQRNDQIADEGCEDGRKAAVQEGARRQIDRAALGEAD